MKKINIHLAHTILSVVSLLTELYLSIWRGRLIYLALAVLSFEDLLKSLQAYNNDGDTQSKLK